VPSGLPRKLLWVQPAVTVRPAADAAGADAAGIVAVAAEPEPEPPECQ
jgi:hypothetical protein